VSYSTRRLLHTLLVGSGTYPSCIYQFVSRDYTSPTLHFWFYARDDASPMHSTTCYTTTCSIHSQGSNHKPILVLVT